MAVDLHRVCAQGFEKAAESHGLMAWQHDGGAVNDRNRHVATGRFRAPRLRDQSRGLPQVYGGRARRTIRDIYEVDHAHGGHGGRFRWFVSTCLAATVGAVAIGVVLYGSIDRKNAEDSLLDQLTNVQTPAPAPVRLTAINDGLNWATPKSDRLLMASSALTARYTIHEQVQVRRNNRPFIQIRPYMRISLRLVPASSTNRDVIPAFNPFRLYAAKKKSASGNSNSSGRARGGDVKIRVVELLGGILPENDGQELQIDEVTALVREANESASVPDDSRELDRVGVLPRDLTPSYLADANSLARSLITDANTTVIRRSTDTGDGDDTGLDSSEVRVVRLGAPRELSEILTKMGAPSWQARAMSEAATTVLAQPALARGYEVRVRLIPSLANSKSLEPDAFAVFGPLNRHIVTVKRSASGEFVADANFDPRVVISRATFDNASARDATLYASIYDAGLMQGLTPAQIMKILRIHAYETDFRQRIQDGDQLELFYELKKQADGGTRIGELLYSSITSAGQKKKFWRFRSRDGAVDYYDENGENSKKFLMRKPVRGASVRLTSGFGYRRHPLLNERRMHTGIDWAAQPGTPILAAGRGIIEEARRRGTYGNYVRIKHANSYQTAYAHMRRFGPGIRPGVRVRQGQVIGFVGSTGLSSGPHLHYEMLVNKRFVDPLKINVPRARRLKGRELAAYQRERTRLSDLMRRSPVRTASR